MSNGGTALDTITYDAFGNITSESNSANRGRYAWTGRELDVETGLQYNRARYYESSTGRWLSQDPLGFNAGDSNLYRYVTNRPTVTRDPSGLDDITFSELIQFAKNNNLPYGVFADLNNGKYNIASVSGESHLSRNFWTKTWTINLSKLRSTNPISRGDTNGLGNAYNEAVNLLLIVDRGKRFFKWADDLIGIASVDYCKMLNQADNSKVFRFSNHETARAMVEEAMSEIADYMRKSIELKLAPRLMDGGIGAPLHNDTPGAVWADARYKDAADKAVPQYISDLTLWIMYNGSQDPLPDLGVATTPKGAAKNAILRMQKLHEFAESVFVNGTEP